MWRSRIVHQHENLAFSRLHRLATDLLTASVPAEVRCTPAGPGPAASESRESRAARSTSASGATHAGCPVCLPSGSSKYQPPLRKVLHGGHRRIVRHRSMMRLRGTRILQSHVTCRFECHSCILRRCKSYPIMEHVQAHMLKCDACFAARTAPADQNDILNAGECRLTAAQKADAQFPDEWSSGVRPEVGGAHVEWAALRGGNSHVAEGGSQALLHRHTSRFFFSPALRCRMKCES